MKTMRRRMTKTTACLVSLALSVCMLPTIAFAEVVPFGDYAVGSSDFMMAQDAADLNAALQEGSTLAITSTAPAKWSVNDSEQGRSYIEASKDNDGASVSVSTPGAGWILWEWKFGDFQKQGYPAAKITASAGDGSNFYPFTDLTTGTDANSGWSTAVAKVGSATTVTWTWTAQAALTDTACIDNIRFVADETPVAAVGDEGIATARVTVHNTEVTTVDPRQATVSGGGSDFQYAITWEATPKLGFVFKGWKADLKDDGFVSTNASYSTGPVFDAATTYYAVSERAFTNGSGTESDPFLLAGAEDLKSLDAYVNGGNTFEGVYFKVSEDIAVDSSFEGIGTNRGTTTFSGHVDGDSHTISGLENEFGLFYKVVSGSIKDLVVQGDITNTEGNSDAPSGWRYGGVVAGMFEGAMTNVSASGSLTTNKGYQQGQSGFGGLVGRLAAGSTISDCSSEVAIVSMYANATNPGVGGIAGQVEYNTTISDCVFTGSIMGTVDGTEQGEKAASTVGGIVGYASSKGNVISGCLVKATIVGSRHVGGILGANAGAAGGDAIAVSNCEFYGDVSGADNVGGIVGHLEGAWSASWGTVESCLAAGTVSASDASGHAGGIVGFAKKAESVSNCLALQESVTCEGDAGRIATGGERTVFAGNAAWTGVLVNGTAVASDDEEAAADKLHGVGADTLALYGTAAVIAPVATWSTDAWVIAAGVKPQLKGTTAIAALSGADYPAYIVRPTMSAIASDINAEYDGKVKGPIVVNVTADGKPYADVTVKYGTSEGAYNLSTAPTFTEVGNYTTFYQVTDPTGVRATVTGSAKVSITKPSTGALEKAIKAAQATYDDSDVVVADSASDVKAGAHYATKAQRKALSDAIAKAQAVVDAKSATADAIAKAASDVSAAEKTYSTAVNGQVGAKKAEGAKMHRLYNPNSGEHFYTSNVSEKDYLASIGWTYEGVGWTAPETSNTPVYRLYNKIGGEHHYTTDKGEFDYLKSIGWNDEGIGWYSDDAKGKPLYRQYNPNAFSNNHNYTLDIGENNWLVGLGWKAEGIGWYGI